MNELDWKRPALFGGLIVGILSAIPGLSAVNCCFCAWALIGGIVAAKMVINQSPRPIKGGDGARVGLMAGLIGAAIFVCISLLIALSGFGVDATINLAHVLVERSGNPELIEKIEQARQQTAALTAPQRLLTTLPFTLGSAVVLSGFTVLGGLLGVALFEKRKGDPPPPPPYDPNGYSGGYQGGGGAQPGGYQAGTNQGGGYSSGGPGDYGTGQPGQSDPNRWPPSDH